MNRGLAGLTLIGLFSLACTPQKSSGGDAGVQPGNQDPNPFHIKLTDVWDSAIGARVRSGLNQEHIGIGNGVAVGDLDGDGLPDLILARVTNPMDPVPDASGPSMLFHNTSNGSISFEEVPSFRSFQGTQEVFAVSMGDYDNDGKLDVFLSCRGKDHLLHNEGNLRFKDVTDKAGVGGPMSDFTTSAIFADVNNDGLLDLFVGQFGESLMDSTTPKRLYLNLGDGTFSDVSVESGVAADIGAMHTALIGDLDGDGILDIWVANDTFSVSKMRQPNAPNLPADSLFQGQGLNAKGTPTFSDTAPDRRMQANRASMGLGVGDFDNDGSLDVIVSDNGPTDLYLWHPDQMAMTGHPDTATGTYEEASTKMKCALGTLVDDKGHGETLVHWGVKALDFDHDGLYEIYLAAGTLAVGDGHATNPANEVFYQLDSYIRQTKAGSEFADITGSVGLPTKPKIGDHSVPLSKRGVFTADLDGDGADDIVLGAYDDGFSIYHNDTPPNSNHYVRLRLRGTVSAPDPVGAIVTVATSDGKMVTRQRIAGGDTYGNSDFVTEIGLGKATPSSVTVAWPSGLVQAVDTLDGFMSDAEFPVTEPQWLTLSARAVPANAPAPTITIKPFDDQGVLLTGADAAAKMVTVTRSDNVKVMGSFTNGVYKATLTKPATTPKRVLLTINIDGNDLAIRPMITFQH